MFWKLIFLTFDWLSLIEPIVRRSSDWFTFFFLSELYEKKKLSLWYLFRLASFESTFWFWLNEMFLIKKRHKKMPNFIKLIYFSYFCRSFSIFFFSSLQRDLFFSILMNNGHKILFKKVALEENLFPFIIRSFIFFLSMHHSNIN